MNSFDQQRITQLISTYGPEEPPALPLEFGDYLSILWRLDQSIGQEGKIRYYRKCAQALELAFEFSDRELGRLVRSAQPGDIYASLSHVPYRYSERALDAADRRAAIQQLLSIRANVMMVGTYNQKWISKWPGSGIVDSELRERVFAVLFTALPSQYPPFARLLLVIDIVLQELLIGSRKRESFTLKALVETYTYPNPDDLDTRQSYLRD